MIAATLTGPSYFTPSYDESNIEVHDTLEDVIEALFERYSSNGRHQVSYTTLDGKHHSVYFPVVEAGTSFTCYRLSADVTPDTVHSDEDVEEVLTAVHGGHWDYTVTLVESEQGTLTATVERAGI